MLACNGVELSRTPDLPFFAILDVSDASLAVPFWCLKVWPVVLVAAGGSSDLADSSIGSFALDQLLRSWARARAAINCWVGGAPQAAQYGRAVDPNDYQLGPLVLSLGCSQATAS